jgi:hypothetical protein
MLEAPPPAQVSDTIAKIFLANQFSYKLINTTLNKLNNIKQKLLLCLTFYSQCSILISND